MFKELHDECPHDSSFSWFMDQITQLSWDVMRPSAKRQWGESCIFERKGLYIQGECWSSTRCAVDSCPKMGALGSYTPVFEIRSDWLLRNDHGHQNMILILLHKRIPRAQGSKLIGCSEYLTFSHMSLNQSGFCGPSAKLRIEEAIWRGRLLC
jgi:hypothetical protein